MTNSFSIADQLNTIRAEITAAESRYHRPPSSVHLLLVSKTQSVAAIQQAVAAGQRHFGENYVQEALPKIATLALQGLEWHFIGPIQANKTQAIAKHFNWVHSVCRLKIAQRLNDERPDDLPPLNVCLQVNVSQDPHKSGIRIEDASALAHQIACLPRLRLRGLMTIPTQAIGFDQQRLPFRLLRLAQEQLLTEGFSLDTLSMGMSDDFEAAIAEGATWVRIGTKVFGPRST